METIVIGHRNPDMDAIVSALAYTDLKRKLGIENIIAARAGNTNPRIDYVLERFGFEPPEFLSDVSPRVRDVMQRNVVSVRADAPLSQAISKIEAKRLRGLPVIDDEGKCLGLLSAFKVSHYLFPSLEASGTARRVTAALSDIVTCLGGNPVAGVLSTEPEELLLMVAAMKSDTFAERLEAYSMEGIVLLLGDREDIQIQAIERGVRAVVITGGIGVSEEVEALANNKGTCLIQSPFDTATTVLLARGAARVGELLDSEIAHFTPDTSLDSARAQAAHSSSFVFPILQNDGQLVGILSKSDFLKPVPRQLILVDHNELSQAVPGADRLPIVEVLDHHRIGGFHTDLPILFWNNPVGSTSTIVAHCYQQHGIPIPHKIAGLLMAGLISDTLNLTSPTTTPADRAVMKTLSVIARVDPAELSESIFSVGSPLQTFSIDQVITADCKEYEEDGVKFSVAQIEELNFSAFDRRGPELIQALARYGEAKGLLFSCLLVTDINTQDSVLLVTGDENFKKLIDFPTRGVNQWMLRGVVSRKKQLLPYLLQLLHEFDRTK